MARIITLKRDTGLDDLEVRKRPRRELATTAEVIIFPGVRYERWGDNPATGNELQGGMPNARDWLYV